MLCIDAVQDAIYECLCELIQTSDFVAKRARVRVRSLLLTHPSHCEEPSFYCLSFSAVFFIPRFASVSRFLSLLPLSLLFTP